MKKAKNPLMEDFVYQIYLPLRVTTDRPSPKPWELAEALDQAIEHSDIGEVIMGLADVDHLDLAVQHQAGGVVMGQWRRRRTGESLVNKLTEGDAQPGYDVPPAETAEVEIGRQIDMLADEIENTQASDAERLIGPEKWRLAARKIKKLADQLIKLHTAAPPSSPEHVPS